MVVYLKRLPMFLMSLASLAVFIVMADGINSGFHDVMDHGGMMYHGNRMSTGVSWMLWLVFLVGDVLFAIVFFISIKLWARITPRITLVMNDQGVFTWKLKPENLIPWTDVEGYEVKKSTASWFVTSKILSIKIKNRERYLPKKRWWENSALEISLFGITERPEAICKYLDEHLHKTTSTTSLTPENSA